MKISKKIIYTMLATTVGLASCNKDVLDRPEKTKVIDKDFWRNQGDVKLYANDFYTNYFVGYNSGFGTAYAPMTGYTMADDFTSEGTQTGFEATVPATRGSTSEVPAILSQQYGGGPNWNFAWVRKANVMINRLDNQAKANLSQEEYNHWMAVARFFRGFEYSRLTSVFGDVPYYDAPVDPTDQASMYKERTPRGEVMDRVYDDFKYVMANMRLDDGAQYVNRYAAAALISNMMLFEGSWQHYHGLDATRSKKYLELAVEAAQFVMDSGKWRFNNDFKSLFASDNLATNTEVIFYRSYDDVLKVTHAVSSYSNGTEGQPRGANLDLLKAFICTDGQIWQNSTVANAKDFTLKNLAKTRDPRFEATFMDTVNTASSTMAYAHKFAGRDALTYIGKTYPAKWGSNTNVSDAPIVRLGEVVLNWIEAKQILAEKFGGPAVTQADLDKSINAIRNRPLDTEATNKGVKKTAPLTLANLPNDPTRDGDVSQLMWEIRRERRMEFVYEYARINDIRRWKKLNYMNFVKEDYSLGPWVNVKKDLPNRLTATYKNVLKVKNANGQIITYDGTNADALVGYYVVARFANRVAFTDRAYLAPVGLNQIQQYTELGYTLAQTPGW
ncbi:RagB/SusD family nutrient uptake outer membrane protein [Sphingobacterium spiritivorum]|uniref:RagB/SusD family nutrient uptake outer membrane protein n=1 Tax=Sphingobacterium spiritivorum TaxID=258 RepID=UPI003DA62DCF